MAITSFKFLLFVFITCILYYAVPKKWKWIVLLAASAVFYISFSVYGIFILIGLSLATYFSALQIQKLKDRQAQWLSENKGKVDKEERKAKRKYFTKRQRLWVALAVVLNVGLLFLFKYYGHFAVNINNTFNTSLWTAENIFLPLGISYFSLQLIGYIVDVSRGIIPAEKNPLKVIMQGPFNRYGKLMPQVCSEERKKHDFHSIKLAVLKITWGYIKKLCIADQMGVITNEIFSNYTEYAGLAIIFGAVCFAIQIYADFSGYMDIILGIGELLGIEMPINFRQPFFSRNITEFWQRWHISLGAWLKDYVFYPVLKSKAFQNLGKWLTKKVGKKAGRQIPTYIGMLILWTLIGVWHGAGFNYVFGVGLLQFIYIFSGEIFKPLTDKIKAKLKIREENLFWHIFQSLRCTALMIFAWVFFNSKSFGDAIQMFVRIVADRTLGLGQLVEVANADSLQCSIINILVYTVLCVCVLLFVDLLREKGVFIREKIESKPYPIRMAFYLACIFTLIVFGAYGTQYLSSNFIYFEF